MRKTFYKYASIFICALFLMSCGEDPIQTYQEPKANTQAFSPNQNPMANAPFMNGGASMNASAGDSMTAAIIYTETEAWFVKLMGYRKDIRQHAQSFALFVSSIQIPGEAPKEISWQLNDGWTEEEGSGFRFATVYTSEPKVEISISKLPVSGADLLANVNRWRGQLQLPAWSEEELKETVHYQKLRGKDAFFVNIYNSKLDPESEDFQKEEEKDEDCASCASCESKAKKAEEAKKAEAEKKDYSQTATENKGHAHFTSSSPAENWEALDASGMRKAAFNIKSGDETGLMTVIQLSAIAGDKLQNVNRWLGQIGEANIDAEALAKIEETVHIDGEAAAYYKLIGKEKSILAVILKTNNQVWFFKTFASTDLIEAEENNFKFYLNSCKFNWHNGTH